MKFSEKVKYVREKLLLSQRDFAKELGVTFSTICLWETDKSIPHISSQKKFFDYCKSHDIKF